MATPGTLKIHAMARGLSVERPLSPRVGETLDLGDLVLRPMGHRVSVVLEGPTGVDLRDVHGRLWGRDAQGRIHPLAGIWGGTPSPNLVPPGVHQVIGKIPGFFCRAGPVDVRPNDPNPLRVRLIPLADVMLRLPPSAPQGTAWTCTYEGPHVVAARWHGAKGWDPMKQSWDWEPGSPRRSGRLSASREVDMASVPPGTWRLEVGEAPQVRTCRFEVPEGVYLHRAELSDLLDEGAGG